MNYPVVDYFDVDLDNNCLSIDVNYPKSTKKV